MIHGKDVILRDFKESDIEKRIYWETVETEWQQWDAPWEYEDLTEAEKESELQEYVKSMHRWVRQDAELSDDITRYRFQIVLNNEQQEYIGWCNAYCIDEDYCYTDDEGYCTVGIDIPELAVRGKGYATQALCMFIKYLLERGEAPIFTQTWSGNHRMIHVAEKIGFEECRRKKDLRMVRGERYDGLTFKLNVEKFEDYLRGNQNDNI